MYTESAALWVGCDREPDNVSFDLGGKYSVLEGQVGFRAGLAKGVVASVVAYGDGEPISAFQVDHDGGYHLQLVVSNVKTLSFAVTRQSGQCGPSRRATWLSRRGSFGGREQVPLPADPLKVYTEVSI